MGFTTNVNYSQATGSNSNNGQVILFEARDPTASDTAYPIGKQWFNTVLNNFWILESFSTTSGYPQAVWEQFGTSMEAITQYAVLVGGASSTIASIAPDASTTKILVSGGLSANPSWQSIGSTGAITTITGNSGGAQSPLLGNFNILGGGSITTVGTSNTETISLTGLTNHSILIGAGTSTITKLGPTSTSGQILQSAGSSADPAFSTATYPSTAPSIDTILRADGTNWVASVAKYPNTTTINQILYSSSTNVLDGIAASIDGVLISNHASGVPSWLANGTAGYVLTAQSGAPPAWVAGSVAGLTVNVQTFTSSGTYTPTAGMKYCKVEVQAPGGGGGASDSGPGGTLTLSVGGGGGSGEYCFGYYSAATIGANRAVTIGSAGSAGSAPSGNGGNGGSCDLGGFIGSNGGLGGTGGDDTSTGASLTSAAGGGGSGGTGGSFRSNGNGGTAGITCSAATLAFSNGGAGAAGYYGGGTKTSSCATVSGGSGVSAPGINGAGYGSGGSGSGNISTAASQPSAAAGGSGASGIIIITEFIAT